ncbi:TonB-dependent siderophore receptor [Methylovulum psychrotolerans]|uniref:TonB-dependent siderophore receptor n=1 Tax=Methylovulum psychrotolerans TaxID=1704499 RepID=A0A1Z4C2P6_9GAMM|nr:TonB-dependent receptor [Methylovulum psychrotolerans]ASF47780.1 TonB-dependent siderophore receptor [Methylovulum psychrotolerans]
MNITFFQPQKPLRLIGTSKLLAVTLANLVLLPLSASAVEPIETKAGMETRPADDKNTAKPKAKTDKKAAAASPQPSSLGETTTLKTMTVTGAAEYDPEDPFNTDYVLPTATAGTKTDTPIMETPLNVQSVSKQVLTDQQVISLDQALRNVSGVTMKAHGVNSVNNGINFGINYPTPVIRGFASQTFFRNGFRLQDNSAARQFSNVESVEVLKGPAAILYGQVEPGGMINIVTKKPQAIPYYSLTQQFGSYDLFRTSIDATGPVGKHDDLLYRINYSYQNSNSFRDLVYTDDVFVAPSLKWIISPKTWVSVDMEYDRNNNGYDSGFIPMYKGKILKTPFHYNWGELSPVRQETYFGNITWAHQFNEAWSVKHQFSVNRATGDSDLFFPYYPNNKGLVENIHAIYNNRNNTFSTNLDLTGHFDTGGLKHTLLLGGDYYHLDAAITSASTPKFKPGKDFFHPIHEPFVAPQVKLATIQFNYQQTDQYGLYAQDQIKLPYNIHLMGGLRYQALSQVPSVHKFYDPATTIPSSEDAVTPRVGVLWQARPWLSLYANYVESFGPNVVSSPGVLYGSNKPIPATGASQYEFGGKTEFFDGRLRTTLAYFDLTKNNIAVNLPQSLGLGGGCGNYTCYLLISEAQSQGIELDIQGEILPGWQVITTFANTHVKVTKGDETGLFGNPGQQLFGVPIDTASFWSTYNFQQKWLRGFMVGGGLTFQGKQYAFIDQNAPLTVSSPFKVAGFQTVSLVTAYSRDVGAAKVSVQLNVENLLDERYFTGLTVENANKYGEGGAYGVYGTPRTFMGQIRIQY